MLLFVLMVNYTIKCNRLKKIKKFIQISGRMELPHNKTTEGEKYELPTSYHRRENLYTKILCGWVKLSKNSKTCRNKCKYDIKRDKKELYPYPP